MLTFILVLLSVNFYFLLRELHGRVWKSGFFWLAIIAMVVILQAYGHAIL